MADPDQQLKAASTFPTPPACLWRSFTAENLEKIAALRKTQAATEVENESGGEKRLDNLPSELINLQPPPEPADGIWRVFGGTYTLKDELPSLEDQGVTRLTPGPSMSSTQGPDAARVFHMKKLAKSALLNFVKLIDGASKNVDLVDAKIDDLSTIFVNLHHTINEYRPHQAREELIKVLRARVDRTERETEEIRRVTRDAEEVLRGLEKLKAVDGKSVKESEGEDVGNAVRGEADQEAAYWAALSKEFAAVDAECAAFTGGPGSQPSAVEARWQL